MKKLLSLVLALALALSAVSAFAEGKERESSTAPPAPSIANMAAAAESYLIVHGMDAEALKTLKEKLRYRAVDTRFSRKESRGSFPARRLWSGANHSNGFRRIQSAEYLPISIISGRKNA